MSKEELNTEEKNKTENRKAKTTKFASILSQLRKERGYSQKKVAADLGISQALLSHYEKGIRECGLDFVVRCSDYYGVTTDFLLGVSKSRFGLDEDYVMRMANEENLSSMNILSNATKMLVDTATAASADVSTARYLHDYYMLCLYRGALTLAKAGAIPTDLFKLDFTTGHELASAAIAVLDARFTFIEDKSRTGADLLSKTALHVLIDEAENYLMDSFVV